MAWESWVERQVREAQERGDFDGLSGAGRPLPGLGGPHDELWWVKDLIRREGLAVTPPALALRREVEDALDTVGSLPTEAVVRRRVEELNVRIRQLNRVAASGPPSTLWVLDVDEVLLRWRDGRDGGGTDGADPGGRPRGEPGDAVGGAGDTTGGPGRSSRGTTGHHPKG